VTTDKEYLWARREHAFLLRCEGLTLAEVGERLGTTRDQVRGLVAHFVGRMNRAMARTRVYYVEHF
jgi:DNA-directed RNA polymerase specialized sigma24 family protein